MSEGIRELSYSLNLSFNDKSSTNSNCTESCIKYVKINKDNTIQTNCASPLSLVSSAVPQALQNVLYHYGVEAKTLNATNSSSLQVSARKTHKESSDVNDHSFSIFKKIVEDSDLNSTAYERPFGKKNSVPLKADYQKTGYQKAETKKSTSKSKGKKRKHSDRGLDFQRHENLAGVSLNKIQNESYCSDSLPISKKIKIYGNVLIKNAEEGSFEDSILKNRNNLPGNYGTFSTTNKIKQSSNELCLKTLNDPNDKKLTYRSKCNENENHKKKYQDEESVKLPIISDFNKSETSDIHWHLCEKQRRNQGLLTGLEVKNETRDCSSSGNEKMRNIEENSSNNNKMKNDENTFIECGLDPETHKLSISKQKKVYTIQVEGIDDKRQHHISNLFSENFNKDAEEVNGIQLKAQGSMEEQQNSKDNGQLNEHSSDGNRSDNFKTISHLDTEDTIKPEFLAESEDQSEIEYNEKIKRPKKTHKHLKKLKGNKLYFKKNQDTPYYRKVVEVKTPLPKLSEQIPSNQEKALYVLGEKNTILNSAHEQQDILDEPNCRNIHLSSNLNQVIDNEEKHYEKPSDKHHLHIDLLENSNINNLEVSRKQLFTEDIDERKSAKVHSNSKNKNDLEETKNMNLEACQQTENSNTSLEKKIVIEPIKSINEEEMKSKEIKDEKIADVATENCNPNTKVEQQIQSLTGDEGKSENNLFPNNSMRQGYSGIQENVSGKIARHEISEVDAKPSNVNIISITQREVMKNKSLRENESAIECEDPDLRQDEKKDENIIIKRNSNKNSNTYGNKMDISIETELRNEEDKKSKKNMRKALSQKEVYNIKWNADDQIDNINIVAVNERNDEMKENSRKKRRSLEHKSNNNLIHNNIDQNFNKGKNENFKVNIGKETEIEESCKNRDEEQKKFVLETDDIKSKKGLLVRKKNPHQGSDIEDISLINTNGEEKKNLNRIRKKQTTPSNEKNNGEDSEGNSKNELIESILMKEIDVIHSPRNKSTEFGNDYKIGGMVKSNITSHDYDKPEENQKSIKNKKRKKLFDVDNEQLNYITDTKQLHSINSAIDKKEKHQDQFNVSLLSHTKIGKKKVGKSIFDHQTKDTIRKNIQTEIDPSENVEQILSKGQYNNKFDDIVVKDSENDKSEQKEVLKTKKKNFEEMQDMDTKKNQILEIVAEMKAKIGDDDQKESDNKLIGGNIQKIASVNEILKKDKLETRVSSPKKKKKKVTEKKKTEEGSKKDLFDKIKYNKSNIQLDDRISNILASKLEEFFKVLDSEESDFQIDKGNNEKVPQLKKNVSDTEQKKDEIIPFTNDSFKSSTLISTEPDFENLFDDVDEDLLDDIEKEYNQLQSCMMTLERTFPVESIENQSKSMKYHSIVKNRSPCTKQRDDEDTVIEDDDMVLESSEDPESEYRKILSYICSQENKPNSEIKLIMSGENLSEKHCDSNIIACSSTIKELGIANDDLIVKRNLYSNDHIEKEAVIRDIAINNREIKLLPPLKHEPDEKNFKVLNCRQPFVDDGHITDELGEKNKENKFEKSTAASQTSIQNIARSSRTDSFIDTNKFKESSSGPDEEKVEIQKNSETFIANECKPISEIHLSDHQSGVESDTNPEAESYINAFIQHSKLLMDIEAELDDYADIEETFFRSDKEEKQSQDRSFDIKKSLEENKIGIVSHKEVSINSPKKHKKIADENDKSVRESLLGSSIEKNKFTAKKSDQAENEEDNTRDTYIRHKSSEKNSKNIISSNEVPIKTPKKLQNKVENTQNRCVIPKSSEENSNKIIPHNEVPIKTPKKVQKTPIVKKKLSENKCDRVKNEQENTQNRNNGPKCKSILDFFKKENSATVVHENESTKDKIEDPKEKSSKGDTINSKEILMNDEQNIDLCEEVGVLDHSNLNSDSSETEDNNQYLLPNEVIPNKGVSIKSSKKHQRISGEMSQIFRGRLLENEIKKIRFSVDESHIVENEEDNIQNICIMHKSSEEKSKNEVPVKTPKKKRTISVHNIKRVLPNEGGSIKSSKKCQKISDENNKIFRESLLQSEIKKIKFSVDKCDIIGNELSNKIISKNEMSIKTPNKNRRKNVQNDKSSRKSYLQNERDGCFSEITSGKVQNKEENTENRCIFPKSSEKDSNKIIPLDEVPMKTPKKLQKTPSVTKKSPEIKCDRVENEEENTQNESNGPKCKSILDFFKKKNIEDVAHTNELTEHKIEDLNAISSRRYTVKSKQDSDEYSLPYNEVPIKTYTEKTLISDEVSRQCQKGNFEIEKCTEEPNKGSSITSSEKIQGMSNKRDKAFRQSLLQREMQKMGLFVDKCDVVENEENNIQNTYVMYKSLEENSNKIISNNEIPVKTLKKLQKQSVQKDKSSRKGNIKNESKRNFSENNKNKEEKNQNKSIIPNSSEEKSNKIMAHDEVPMKTSKKPKKTLAVKENKSSENKCNRVENDKENTQNKSNGHKCKSILDFFKKENSTTAVHKSESTEDKIEDINVIGCKKDTINSTEILINSKQNIGSCEEVGVSDHSNIKSDSKEPEDKDGYSFADILSQVTSKRLEKEFHEILEESSRQGVQENSDADKSSHPDDILVSPRKRKKCDEKKQDQTVHENSDDGESSNPDDILVSPKNRNKKCDGKKQAQEVHENSDDEESSNSDDEESSNSDDDESSNSDEDEWSNPDDDESSNSDDTLVSSRRMKKYDGRKQTQSVHDEESLKSDASLVSPKKRRKNYDGRKQEQKVLENSDDDESWNPDDMLVSQEKSRKKSGGRKHGTKDSAKKEKAIKLIKESKSIWEIQKELDIYKKDEQKKKVENLVINNPYPLSKIQKMAPFSTNPPSEKHRQRFSDVGIKLKLGHFSEEEDKKIITNWKDFCQQNNLDENDYLPFVNGSEKSKYGVLSCKQFGSFVQWISHDFENRTMNSVFDRFRRLHLFKELESGRYYDEDDRVILEYLKVTDSSAPFADIGTILNRKARSVRLRHKLLKIKKKYKVEKIHWTKALVEKLLVTLAEETCTINLLELKDYKITSLEWSQVAKRMKLPPENIRRSWLNNLYPRFFSDNYSEHKGQTRGKLIDIVSSRYSNWKEVDWNAVSKKMGEGFPAITCRKILHDLVRNKVPLNIKNNFKEALLYLKGEDLEPTKDYYSFVKEIWKETKNGTILPRIKGDEENM